MRALTLTGWLLIGAAAPSAQSTSVPADLFYAVANVRDASSVVVGHAPERLLPLFPEGAEVLGTLGRIDRSGIVTDDVVPDRPTHATAIARVGAAPADVARSYDLDPPSGWRSHNTTPVPEGGFASSAPLGSGVVLCPVASGPDDEPVRVEFALRPGGGTYVTVSEGGWYRVRCDGTADEPSSPFDDYGTDEVTLADLPVLSPPAQGRQQTRGGGGSNDYQNQDAALTWSGEAEVALRHYGGQLEAAGWAPLASGGGAETAAGTWSRPSDGGPLMVTITVALVEPSQFALRLILTSNS